MSFLHTALRGGAFLSTLALAACGGAGLGNSIPGNVFGFQCNPGTQIQLARPAPGQFNASNVSQIEIVANGNSNMLYNTFGQWNLVLQDNFGDPPITTAGLNLVSDPSGPHPYSSDFYYMANIGSTLPAGATWTVTLEQQPYGSCSPAPVGTFST